MDNRQKVYTIISNVLGIDIKTVNEKTGPDNVESWDSFNALMLISEFEDKFKLSFTLEEVEKVQNVKNIINLLKKHAVKFNGEKSASSQKDAPNIQI